MGKKKIILKKSLGDKAFPCFYNVITGDVGVLLLESACKKVLCA